MAGGNFMNRVISYLVNEIVVNGLANSPAFQRFAVRTSKRIEDVSNLAVQKRRELAEQMKDMSKNFEISENKCFLPPETDLVVMGGSEVIKENF
ncbi:hypothetical protein HHK36_016175 [Tetracentron sinense]|uniref:Uncharacterized protein n=1 Tax=Tetracentron sinense TaxID=13715 RepID=A0A834YZ87_TETSI|nr:hypothetical protein HHK36_016175 [Tetracentron sinense]